MQPKWWEILCDHWASEEVLQVSAQKRKNRYTGGSAQHTAGSWSIAMHRKLKESVKRRLEEAGDAELDPHLVWAQEVGGRNRGRYYGLHGIIDKARIDAMAKSATGCIDKETERDVHAGPGARYD
uniref:Uncharacterized protein n=1 Tax=Arundo donax TaxID=35708 RepID=A0A0A8Z492_ARUDO